MLELNLSIFLVLTLSSLSIMARRRNPQEIGVTDYIIRITNITECPGTKHPHDYNMTLVNRNFTHYLSVRVNLTEDYTVTRSLLKIDRCIEHEYGCENFQTWNFTNFCHWFRMKNQVWSSMVEKIRPSAWRYTCPTFLKKGIYSAKDLNIDVKQLLMYYPDMYKYFWKLSGSSYTPSENLVGCVYGAGQIMKYTRRKG